MSNQTFSIWDGSVASSFGGGSGTETDPYCINSAAQLAYLEEVFDDPDVTNNKYYGKYYKLTRNIDLDKREWAPIGDSMKLPYPEYLYLAIHFDGGNHIVRGLYIDRPEENNKGLFGSVSKTSSFKHIIIEDAYVLGKQNIGGLIGVLGSSQSVVENCHFSGEIHGYQAVGGIIGSGSGAYLKNCSNTGTITTDCFGGGIAGSYGNSSEVVNCANTGTITGRSSNGGIVGYASNRTLFKYCHNSGNVLNEQRCAGGITCGPGSFEYCSNSGSITVGTSYVGGITGGDWSIVGTISGGYLKNCHNSGTITGADHVGGLIGSSPNITIDLCNNTGTVTGTNKKIGGICGNCQGDSTIEYCTNEGAVNCMAVNISSGGRVGGIVGEGRYVKQCHNTGSVKGYNDVAGICGYCSYTDSLIAGCVNDGFIEATSDVGGIASYFYGTIQNCISMAPIKANSGAGGIVYMSRGAVINCYNTGSITGSHSLGGIIYSTVVDGFILEKNYNSGEIGSTNNSGAIIGLLGVNGVQIMDCHYHAGSAQKGIGGYPKNVSIEATGYVESVVSADDPKTVPAMLIQSIMTNTLAATFLSWSKKKQQLLTQISKLVSISKSLGIGQDEDEKPLNEIAGDDMYIVTEHTPVRESADPNSNIIAMSFKKDMVKVLPQTFSSQGDYYRILVEENRVGLLSSASLIPANIRGAGNTSYTVTAKTSVFKHPSRWCNHSVGQLNNGDKVQSVPNSSNMEDIVEEDLVYWIKVSYNGTNGTTIGWVQKSMLEEDLGKMFFKAQSWLELAEGNYPYIYSTKDPSYSQWTGGFNATADLTFGIGHSIKTAAEFTTISNFIANHSAVDIAAEVQRYLQNDLADAVKAVNVFMTNNNVSLQQNQFDATVSLVFNYPAALSSSSDLGVELLKNSSSGNFNQQNIIIGFTYTIFQGSRIDGLVTRRNNELNLFFNADYNNYYDSKQNVINAGIEFIKY